MSHLNARPPFARTCWTARPGKLPICSSLSSCWSAIGLPLHFGQCGSLVRASANSPTAVLRELFRNAHDISLLVLEQFESACGNAHMLLTTRVAASCRRHEVRITDSN